MHTPYPVLCVTRQAFIAAVSLSNGALGGEKKKADSYQSLAMDALSRAEELKGVTKV